MKIRGVKCNYSGQGGNEMAAKKKKAAKKPAKKKKAVKASGMCPGCGKPMDDCCC